jgi:hypothetical protein
MPAELSGLLALLALTLLPGVVVVRAPWWSVPFLSLGFWSLTWWWLPADRSRLRFLLAALAAFALLALLRLLPRRDPSAAAVTPAAGGMASWPARLVLGVAVLTLGSLALGEHAPGRLMAFRTAEARLAAWREHLPLSYEPLLPIEPFAASSPALSLLAADVVLLSGLGAPRALLLVALAGPGLLAIALFGLWLVRGAPGVAAAAALGGVGVAPWVIGEPSFGLAFGVAGVALIVGHGSRWSAAAAGPVFGAGALAAPGLATAAFGVAAALRPRGVPGRGERAGRLRLAAGLALAAVLPCLWRLWSATSAAELWSGASGWRLDDLMQAVGMLSTLVFFLPFAAALVTKHPVWVGLIGATLLVARAGIWVGAGQLEARERLALERLAKTRGPLEVVCAPEHLREWVLALSGRPIGAPGPRLPPLLREEGRAAHWRPCTVHLGPHGEDIF